MTIADLIKYLGEFNGEADVKVVIHGKPHPFQITYGCAEGVTKSDASDVSFMVDTDNERTKKTSYHYIPKPF